MKTYYKLLLPVLVMFALKTSAQAPQVIPYEAVARNNSGNAIANQNISLRFTIHDATSVGTIVYKETQSKTTNSFGLFTANIGQGTVVTGIFSSINWGGGSEFIQVEMDASGGITYVDMGTQQMLSVPYALFSAGSNETDPKISSSTISKVPRWNGTNLVDGSIFDNAANVGIGTATPEFKLSLDNDGGILAKGTFASGAALTTTGAGTRMFWYPKKSAFRAGNVDGTQWDNANIGDYSFATGFDSKASGIYSTAMGANNTANGDYSTSFGSGTVASGLTSTALGSGTIASGIASTAMGDRPTASGNYSTAMGYITNAIGDYSTSMGYQTNASGNYSTVMGASTIASGNYSTAMGYLTIASGLFSTAIGTSVSTNLATGSFAVGDISTGTVMNSSAANQYSARFAGGYRFFCDPATSPAYGMFFNGGRLGIGTTGPNAILSLCSNGIELGGTAASTTLRTNAGALGTSNGNVVKMASFGFTTGNTSSLGIMAYRNGAGTDYHSAVIVLGMDVDNTSQVGGAYLAISNNGNIGIGTAAPSYTLEVAGTAGKPGGGTWTATSDARLKQNVKAYTDGLDALLKIKPVTFQYNEKSGYDTKPQYIGVIAQDLIEIAPYMVGSFKKDEETFYNVDNSAMTYMLINSVKEQQKQIENQNKLITAINLENENLKAENTSFKSDIEKIKVQLGMEAKAEK